MFNILRHQGNANQNDPETSQQLEWISTYLQECREKRTLLYCWWERPGWRGKEEGKWRAKSGMVGSQN